MKLLTKARYNDRENEREIRNRQVAYKAACESVVMLKNDGTLPLKDRFLALYGSGAKHTVKGGTGSGEVNERHSVSIFEGLTNRGIDVLSTEWLDDYEKDYEKAVKKYEGNQKIASLNPMRSLIMTHNDFVFPEGRKVTKKDVKHTGNGCCVYVISRLAGEGGDRKLEKGDYYLSDSELANIRFCAENYMRFVLIINSGAPIDLSFLYDIPSINSVLYTCQLGTEGGNAIADILSGKVSPSGKLTDTWPMNYQDIPNAMEYSALNGDTDNEYYTEGIFVGYRYYDSFGVKPRYCFGYGLGYTDFELSEAKASADKTAVRLSVKVKNTGKKHSGKEVVQLYVSAPEGEINKEYQSLAAFKKSSLLEPKQSETLELAFDLKQLASYRERDAAFVLEKGDYILRLGNSSADTKPIAVLRLDDEAVVSKHSHVCPVHSPFTELKAPECEKEDLSALPVIEIKAADIETVRHRYMIPAPKCGERAEDFVRKLSVEDMAELCVGVGIFGQKPKFVTPGAAGFTSPNFWSKGLANVTLCDGPAGLRLEQRSVLYGSGEIKSTTEPGFLPAAVRKKLVGDPDKGTVLYQYTTAFPVASALAQSWNTEIMYEVGSAILDEMREYGCTYWLAPAINIHRNPLCGRNFEYYSEDPFLTGTMASALIRGVQQEEGFYVTVKHFACNNQEENRNGVSSNVTERALREIYLRGFELTVKEGGAKSVMTSYNKVNGVLTPTSHDLCTKLLRNEWGFTGVVMTDWFSTSDFKNADALAIKAGNDLIMPGGKKAKQNIISAVKTGLLSEDELRLCCMNVVGQIMQSAIQREYIDR